MTKKTVAEQTKTGQVNSFTGGLNTDLHPMLQPTDTLTDCVNGTLITYNGNENMLQNDMGNYALRGAKLPANYVPIGMKEHAGILYVVAYNPTNKKVQIGSYPSPKINFDDPYGDEDEITVSPYKIKSRTQDEFDPFEVLQTEKLTEDGEHHLHSNIVNSADNSIQIIGTVGQDDFALSINDRYKLNVCAEKDPVYNTNIRLSKPMFAVSDTKENIPTVWETSKPENIEDKYLWEKVVLEYTSENVSNVTVYNYSSKEDTGSKYDSDTIVCIEYAVGDSVTTVPTKGWQSNIPVIEKGKYLWTKTIFKFSEEEINHPWMQELKYFCISKEGKIEDITDQVVTNNGFQNVDWQSFGWIGAKYELADVTKTQQVFSEVVFPGDEVLDMAWTVEDDNNLEKAIGYTSTSLRFYENAHIYIPVENNMYSKVFLKDCIPSSARTLGMVYKWSENSGNNSRIEPSFKKAYIGKSVDNGITFYTFEEYLTDVFEVLEPNQEFEYLYLFLPYGVSVKETNESKLCSDGCKLYLCIDEEFEGGLFSLYSPLEFLNIPKDVTFAKDGVALHKITELYMPEEHSDFESFKNVLIGYLITNEFKNTDYSHYSIVNFIVNDVDNTNSFIHTIDNKITYTTTDGNTLNLGENDYVLYDLKGEDHNTLVLKGRTCKIPEELFKDKTTLKTINIPSSITEIGNRAFYNCTNLHNISFEGNIKSLGTSVFYKCTCLQSFPFDKLSIDEIPSNAFESSGLSGTFNGSKFKKIGSKAFYECESLDMIILEGSVEHISLNAFSGCCQSRLSVITIGENVSYIETQAFKDCCGILRYYGNVDKMTTNDEPFKDSKFSRIEIYSKRVSSRLFGGDKSCIKEVFVSDDVIEFGSQTFMGVGGTLYAGNELLFENQMKSTHIETIVNDQHCLYGAKFTELYIQDNIYSLPSYWLYQLFHTHRSIKLSSLTIYFPKHITDVKAPIGDNEEQWGLQPAISFYFTGIQPPNFHSYWTSYIIHANINVIMPDDVVNNPWEEIFSGFGVTIKSSIRSDAPFYRISYDDKLIQDKIPTKSYVGYWETTSGEDIQRLRLYGESICINRAVINKNGSNTVQFLSNRNTVDTTPTVVHLGDYLFSGKTTVGSITLNSLQPQSYNLIIGHSAFEDSSAQLSMPDRVDIVYVGDNAFKESANISFGSDTTITPSYIGDNAFYYLGTKSVPKINFEKIKRLGEFIFNACNVQIQLHDGMYDIVTGRTFGTGENLSVMYSGVPTRKWECYWYYNDPDSSTSEYVEMKLSEPFEAGILENCKNLNKVIIDTEDIPDGAFENNVPECIEFTDKVKSVGDRAFAHNKTNAESYNVILGTGLESIGINAFSNTKVASLDIPSIDSWLKIQLSDDTLMGSETSIRLPENQSISDLYIENVETINPYAFANWKGLKHVTIGRNVSSIGNNAFAGSSIETVLINSKEEYTLGDNAFADCDKLSWAVLRNSPDVTNTNTGTIFKNSNSVLVYCSGNLFSDVNKADVYFEKNWLACSSDDSDTRTIKIIEKTNEGTNITYTDGKTSGTLFNHLKESKWVIWPTNETEVSSVGVIGDLYIESVKKIGDNFGINNGHIYIESLQEVQKIDSSNTLHLSNLTDLFDITYTDASSSIFSPKIYIEGVKLNELSINTEVLEDNMFNGINNSIKKITIGPEVKKIYNIFGSSKWNGTLDLTRASSTLELVNNTDDGPDDVSYFFTNIKVETCPEIYMKWFMPYASNDSNWTYSYSNVYVSGKPSDFWYDERGGLNIISHDDKFIPVYPDSWQRRFNWLDEYKSCNIMVAAKDIMGDTVPDIYARWMWNVLGIEEDDAQIGWKVEQGSEYDTIIVWIQSSENSSKWTTELVTSRGMWMLFPTDLFGSDDTVAKDNVLWINSKDQYLDTKSSQVIKFTVGSELRVPKDIWKKYVEKDDVDVIWRAKLSASNTIGEVYSTEFRENNANVGFHESRNIKINSRENFYILTPSFKIDTPIPADIKGLTVESIFYCEQKDSKENKFMVLDQTYQTDTLLLPEYVEENTTDVKITSVKYDVGWNADDQEHTVTFTVKYDREVKGASTIVTLYDLYGTDVYSATSDKSSSTDEHQYKFTCPLNVQVANLEIQVGGIDRMTKMVLINSIINAKNSDWDRNDMTTLPWNKVIDAIIAEENNEWKLKVKFEIDKHDSECTAIRYTLLDNSSIDESFMVLANEWEKGAIPAKVIPIVDKNGEMPEVGDCLFGDFVYAPTKMSLLLGDNIRIGGTVKMVNCNYAKMHNNKLSIEENETAGIYNKTFTNEYTLGTKVNRLFPLAVNEVKLIPDKSKSVRGIPIRRRFFEHLYRPFCFDDYTKTCNFDEEELSLFDEAHLLPGNAQGYWLNNRGLYGEGTPAMNYGLLDLKTKSGDNQRSTIANLKSSLPTIFPVKLTQQNSDHGVTMPVAVEGEYTTNTWYWHMGAWYQRYGDCISSSGSTNADKRDTIVVVNENTVWTLGLKGSDLNNGIHYSWMDKRSLWSWDTFKEKEKEILLAGLAVSKIDRYPLTGLENGYYVSGPITNNSSIHSVTFEVFDCTVLDHGIGDIKNITVANNVNTNKEMAMNITFSPTVQNLNEQYHFYKDLENYDLKNGFLEKLLARAGDVESNVWGTKLTITEDESNNWCPTQATIHYKYWVWCFLWMIPQEVSESTLPCIFGNNGRGGVALYDGYGINKKGNYTSMYWGTGDTNADHFRGWPMKGEDDIFCQLSHCNKFVNNGNVTINGTTKSLDNWIKYYLKQLVRELKYLYEYKNSSFD